MKQKRVRKPKRKSRFNFEKFVFTIKYTSLQEMRVGKVKSVFTKTEDEKVCWLGTKNKKRE